MPSRVRPIAAVVFAAMLFGTAGTAQELGPDTTTPLGVGAVRITLGTAVLWIVILWGTDRVDRRRIAASVRSQGRLVALGGVGVAVYTPMFLIAVDRTGVAVGTVVAIGSGPFFAGAFEWAARGVRPGLGWLVGTVIVVSGGALLVASAQSGVDEVDALGIGCALLSGSGYALYSVTAKTTMGRGVEATLAMAAPFTVGAIAVAAMAVGQPFGWLREPGGVAMALELGVLATGVAYVLFGYGLHRLSSATTVTLVLAEPLTAALLATIVLDESIGALGWVGVAILLSGLVIVGRTAEVSIEPVEPHPTPVG
ncbi:MAG: EamA family transporter [Ilumatobacteraceae bacterium]